MTLASVTLASHAKCAKGGWAWEETVLRCGWACAGPRTVNAKMGCGAVTSEARGSRAMCIEEGESGVLMKTRAEAGIGTKAEIVWGARHRRPRLLVWGRGARYRRRRLPEEAQRPRWQPVAAEGGG